MGRSTSLAPGPRFKRAPLGIACGEGRLSARHPWEYRPERCGRRAAAVVAEWPQRVLNHAVQFLEVVLYAIIRSGGKQYRVAAGESLHVERDVLMSADKDKVTFGEVLMIGGDQPQLGAPMVKGASVAGTIVSEMRGEKIIVFKKKRRKNHTKRTHGHRQDVVLVRIDSINV